MPKLLMQCHEFAQKCLIFMPKSSAYNPASYACVCNILGLGWGMSGPNLRNMEGFVCDISHLFMFFQLFFMASQQGIDIREFPFWFQV